MQWTGLVSELVEGATMTTPWEVMDGDPFCLPCNKDNISFLWRKDIDVNRVDTWGKVSGLVNEYGYISC